MSLFQYVVLRPVAPSPSDDIPAARGQMQVQNYKIISEYHRIRQLFKLFLTLCVAEESSLLLKENGAVRVRTWLAKKEQALQKGERSLQTGKKVLGNREKGTGKQGERYVLARCHRPPSQIRAGALTSWSTRPFMLERTAESDFYSLVSSFFGKYSQRRLSRTFHRRGCSPWQRLSR